VAETTERIEEYRVVGERNHGERLSVQCGSLAHARARAERLAEGSSLVAPWRNVRVQKSETFRTPWVDLDEQVADA
jgi:hypothetical protein